MTSGGLSPERMSVLIIGAGIGGLTLAVALQRAGYRVRIFERAATLSEVGAGITLAENAHKAYRSLDLADAIDAHADLPDIGAIKDFTSGNILQKINLQSGPHPVRQLHRADLHNILVDAVRACDPAAIALDHTFADLSQDDGSITAHFTNGVTATGDLLVGCDGNQSAVRTQLFGAGAASFLNYVAWRGLVPAASLPTDCVWPDTGVFQGADRSFVRYKLRRGTLINYVAFARTTEWTADSWMLRSTANELLDAFSGAAAEVKSIINATPADGCFKWGLIGRTPMAKWSVGRATLLGDAAHAMLPFLGQGAGMAIEDGIILARVLASSENYRQAFARYEAARVARTTLVSLGSRHAGLKMHGVEDDATADAGRDYHEAAVAQYDPVTVHV